MCVKKQIALLLSGAILAGSLAGCSRTIIEHQFHTNTVTDTEYIEIGNSGSQQTLLTNFFTRHGITVQFILSELDDEEFEETFGPYLNDQEISSEQIEKFYNGKYDEENERAEVIFKVIECDGTEEGWSSAWAECINALYSAVFTYASDPNNGWDWDQFYENGDFVGVVGLLCELENGKYYCGAYMAHTKASSV